MSAERIGDAAEALLGPAWTRPQLALALGWDLRRVQRWCSGSEEPPEHVWELLRRLLRERQVCVGRALRCLEEENDAPREHAEEPRRHRA